MKQVAVIVNHIFKDDYRVNVIEVGEDMTKSEIISQYETTLMGNFEVVDVTDKVYIK